PETDNLELEELFQHDQEDRQKVFDTPKALEYLQERDQTRRKRVYAMIELGEVQTKNDLYHAGIILHHSDRPEDHLVSHRFAALAAVMGHKTARWLMAAALDRTLMSLGRPQIYGTQFEYNASNHQYELKLPLQDSLMLSFEKKFLGIPSIQERLEELNRHLGEKKVTQGDV